MSVIFQENKGIKRNSVGIKKKPFEVCPLKCIKYFFVKLTLYILMYFPHASEFDHVEKYLQILTQSH